MTNISLVDGEKFKKKEKEFCSYDTRSGQNAAYHEVMLVLL